MKMSVISGNPEDLKDDALKMTSTELQALLESLREPEAANREQYATASHLEDEEISEDETERQEETDREEEAEADEVAEIGGNERSRSRSGGGEIDHLSSKQPQTSIPALPAPESTPPRASQAQALLAATLIISDRESNAVATDPP